MVGWIDGCDTKSKFTTFDILTLKSVNVVKRKPLKKMLTAKLHITAKNEDEKILSRLFYIFFNFSTATT